MLRGHVAELIFAQRFGRKSFNLDVPERTSSMEALYNGDAMDGADQPESNRNILGRYADIEEGLRLRLEPVDWTRAFQHGESLARRFSLTLCPGGHDLVLVAAAVTMGATCFLSFDSHSRQRPLAAAAGLQVWPPLRKEENGLVRHASRVR